jgi:hypothetical protein
MGKDKEGKYHPPKGKPSGTRTQKGVTTTNSSTLDQQLEIEDKYTDHPDIDSVAANVRVRHPNRNVDKGNERKLGENKKSEPGKNVTENIKEEEEPITGPNELTPFISKETLQELANYSSDCCISIYIPTHRSGVEVNEQMDSIAFKNSLQQIENNLKEREFDQARIAKILKPGYDLLRDEKFWYGLTEGLSFYISDGHFKFMRLLLSPPEKLVINSSFYLSPLVPYMLNNEYFYLLVLSKKQAKFFRANNFGMTQIEVPELPNGVDDVVHFEEKDDQKLFRTGSSGAGQGANYHGIGGGKPDDKENISMYLEEVDETLWKEILNKENAPLLLAGVEYLLPIFRKVSHYKNIWEKNLTGSLEHTDDTQLYRQARDVMEPYFQEKVNKAKETFGNQSATTLTTTVPEEIIPAAFYSRVSQLFVQKNTEIWGTFDEKSNHLFIHNEHQNNDDSLLDKAILKTMMNGGEVFILEKNEMPNGAEIAALMRY